MLKKYKEVRLMKMYDLYDEAMNIVCSVSNLTKGQLGKPPVPGFKPQIVYSFNCVGGNLSNIIADGKYMIDVDGKNLLITILTNDGTGIITGTPG